jgi:hypothetical protein
MEPVRPRSTYRWRRSPTGSSIDELRSETGIVATLELSGSRARAEIGEDRYRFERDVTRTVRVWDERTGQLIGESGRSSWAGRRSVRMASGQAFVWEPAGFLRTRWRFRVDSDPAIDFRLGNGVYRSEAVVTVGDQGQSVTDLGLLATLGRYLWRLDDRDDAAAGVAAAVGTITHGGTLVALAVITALSLAACSVSSPRSDRSDVRTEDRPVATFTELAVANAIDADVRLGGAPSVSVTAPASDLPHVVTSVIDGRLRVEMDRSSTGTDDVRVSVSVPSLTRVEAGTAASVAIAGLDAPSFVVHATESADLSMTGRVESLEVTASEASDLDLTQLRAGNARIDVGTAADLTVEVVGRVDGAVHESGTVRILGTPVVDIDQSTSGTFSVD